MSMAASWQGEINVGPLIRMGEEACLPLRRASGSQGRKKPLKNYFFAILQVTDSRAAIFPSVRITAVIKYADDTTSSSFTEISISSPGLTIFLNFTSFIRVITGTMPSSPVMIPDNINAPACAPHSHKITPGTIGWSG